jgi:hypothetical protein
MRRIGWGSVVHTVVTYSTRRLFNTVRVVPLIQPQSGMTSGGGQVEMPENT